MTADTVVLIKLLTDMILTSAATLQKVQTMSEEEVKQAIQDVEQDSVNLMERLNRH